MKSRSNYPLKFNPDSKIIQEDLQSVYANPLPWKDLAGKHVVITGATGMLAAYIAEVLAAYSEYCPTASPVRITLLVRDVEKARFRFARYSERKTLRFVQCDLSAPLPDLDPCHYIVHGASIPNPDLKIPVAVLAPNVLGTWNLLEYARRSPDFEQFLYLSSGSVYGEGMDPSVPQKEDVYYSVPSFSVKSCYAEGKRAGEAICAAFSAQYGIACKILRYVHTFGPGMDLDRDKRSFSAFVRNILLNEDIVLRSDGSATRHFLYISDATSAFFYVLFKGLPDQAYNIAKENNEMSILDLAEMMVSLYPEKNLKVVRDLSALPKGYVPQNYIYLPDITRLKGLGFLPSISPKIGFQRTVESYIND
ncbi:MAG: NAD-dependent epimerase/dehydratase family protein [Planctomycetia bacterium]|nr:NAD-dependent epimerase/dehydratase family protein [Planctomycetia bacterium]